MAAVAKAANSANRAYDALKQSIMAGRYPLGSRLKEKDLSIALAVSRTPIREALFRLQTEGLVKGAPNKGLYVAGWEEQDLIEIFDLRALLEGYAAREAARRMDSTTIAALSGLCAQMESVATNSREERARRITELNNKFHLTILEASGNSRLRRVVQQLVEFPLVYRTIYLYSPDDLARSFDSHRELISAYAASDAEWAETVMHSHIRSARHVVLNRIRAGSTRHASFPSRAALPARSRTRSTRR